MDYQVVIVTGAARGIGFGIAQCFARKGAALVIADLEIEPARNAAAELKQRGARDTLAVQCDVAQRSEVEGMVARTVAAFGRIDVLVNNAGICPFIEVMELTPETWQRTLDVNLTGPFHCTQLVARKMIERGAGGRIVFITSLAENVTGPAQVDYGASKAGLRMTMVGFATALGPHGITCNAVAPGMILTPMTAFHWEKPENAEFIKKRVPTGRIGTPEDIGNACVFLASPEAAYISGITLRVDGGHQAVCC
jgi:NAD(P)-dependent dehydrogenase (short-subunit alcohol dehydrogenase family)